MNKKIIHEIRKEVVTENGELKRTEEIKTYQLPSEPPYVKLYIDDLVKINNLPKGNSAILYELVKLLSYDGQIILNGAIKSIIAKRLKIKKQTIANALVSFCKKDIMIRFDTGLYLLNPNLFAKGEWSNIRRLREKYLELRITYKNGKREMKSKFITEVSEENSTLYL